MPRILGVDIPREKRIEAALPYLYGIGWTRSLIILEEAKVDPGKRAKDLTEEELIEECQKLGLKTTIRNGALSDE